MSKAINFICKNTHIVATIMLVFATGLVFYDMPQQDQKVIDEDAEVIKYDYSRLTPTTCKTIQECEIAEAIEFYEEYKLPLSVPVLEPVDCSDLHGTEKAACEKSNKENAGKPVIYPAICEPYIH